MQLEMEGAIRVEDRWYCPYVDCGQLMELQGAAELQPDERARCRACGKDVCLWCRTPTHPDLTCGENRVRSMPCGDLVAVMWRPCLSMAVTRCRGVTSTM